MDFKNAFDPYKNLFDNIDNLNDCKNYDVLSFNDTFKVVNKHNFNILSFNIRSFSKNSDEFLVFLDNINIKFDIIILVETWATVNTLSLISIDGYKGFHSIREGKVGGGVSIFIKSIFNCFERININNDIIETISLDINLISNKIFNVVCIYLPPHSNISLFNDSIEDLFNKLVLKTNSSIVGGDFNLCLFKSENDQNIKAFINIMS